MKKIHRGFLDGGAGLTSGNPFPSPDGGPSITLREVLASVHSSYTNAAAVEALTTNDHNGAIMVGTTLFVWNPTSLANDSTKQLAIRPTVIASDAAGRFEIASSTFAISMAHTFETANNAVLFTVPVGFRLIVQRMFHRVSADYVNSSGRVGASSSNSAYNTAGDLIGGSGGDAAAALTIGVRGGTIGTKFGSNGAVELIAGDTIKWNVIASGYTAGAGELIAIVTRT